MNGGGEFVTGLVELGIILLGSRFRFEGRVPSEKALDGIDVLLFLNPNEPSGRVVAEAQIAGITVVVPNAGGASEFVEHGKTGFRFRPGDASSAAAVLDEALTFASRNESVALSIREYAQAAYDAVGQSRKYEAALDVSTR